ncbi:MAG: glycosyltransferase family 25 protein [Gammaproteobacteria bacterium]|nr:glycosyltransferase family 25 protein [Gammaproteobacteria bacterium]MCY4227094.1 glycosyltransferase family 25 protein [Gammaproteobacteria bacterium]
MLPVRIINLETSTERRLYMQEQMAAMGLDYRIVTAVDGNLLSRDEVDEICRANAMLLRRGSHLSLGEVGCAFSHIRLYREILDDDVEAMVILEDDARIDKRILLAIEQYRHFPEDWDIVFLGCRIRATSLNTVRQLPGKISLKQPGGFGHVRLTTGYIVSLQGAGRLLRLTRDLHKPIDHYTGNYRLLNTYIVDPALVLPAGFPSTIGYQEKKEKEIGLWLKVCPWLKHCPGTLELLGRRGPLRGTLRVGVALRYQVGRLLYACNLLGRRGQ